MDRRASFATALLVAAALLIATAAAADNLLFQDDFEAIPGGAYPAADGWARLMAGKNAYVATGVSVSGTKSFRLDSWPWSGRMDCITLAQVPDRLSYEASVRADATSGWIGLVGFMSIYGKTGLMWDYFRVDGKTGRVTFYGQTAMDVGPYARGQWCKVRADLDFKSATADLWVNDLPVAQDVAITPSAFYYAPLGNVVLNQWGVSSPASFAMSNIIYFDDVKLWEPEIILKVQVDVKPGDEVNPINLRSRGVVPVCVFSSAEFDATQIDPSTVDFAGAGVAVRGRGQAYMAHPEDVDGDGVLDLMLQFQTQALDPAQLQEGRAVLTGATYGGQQFTGQDEIVLVGRAAPARSRR